MFQVRQGVAISGENPGMTLYAPGSDHVVVKVSYWRTVYSEYGEGNALIIWVDPDRSGIGALAPHAIYTDNPPMATFAWETFTRHFPEFQGYDFSGIEPSHARFTQESDSRLYHRIGCNTGTTSIELVWWDPLARQMVTREGWELGERAWDLATVICPCASALVRVNRHRVIGDPHSSTSGERPQSTAFMAFSETWVEHH